MDLLFFYVPEWFFVAFNLSILVIVLRKIFWQPIGRILDERQQIVSKSLADAETIQTEMAQLETHRNEMQADMDKQAATMHREARSKAGKEYDRIIADAEERARAILTAAQERVNREHEGMMASARAEVKAAALALAGALLETELTPEKNERLIDEVLAQRGMPL